MSIKSKTAEWLARTAVKFPRTFWFVFRLREWVMRTWRENQPGDRAWRGAALGLVVATIIVVADAALHRAFLPYPTFARVAGVGRGLREAALWGIGLMVLASIVARMPWRYRIALGVCGGILASAFPFSFDEWSLAWGIVAFSAAGAGLAVIGRGDIREMSPLARRIAIAGVVFGTGTVVYLAYWMFNPGFEPLEYRNAAVEAADEGAVGVGPLALPDPSRRGDYGVLTLTYGSGDDMRRPHFGRDADLITPTVDGRPFLSSWSGRGGEERKNFWGFDRDELPLQGTVWYPDGDGPFPLVLIVHGNHSMYDYSDPGYRYLGEMLASRGYILVSVDENFINGGIRGENDARGWLLLEHLKVWELWDAGIPLDLDDDEADLEADNVFRGRVDMSRIGLMGHSRGGEAVAVAAAFNALPYYPDDATVPFDYGFDLGAIVAIAPVMGQYQPAGRYTDIHDVNYFVIHGANDGDVSSFNGAGQYEHVRFSGDVYRFKSSVYVMGANHGQFNQTWGSWDSGAPFGRSLSTRSLIAEEDQRKVAEVYIGAFLDATLGGETAYLPLFVDARRGSDWLPDTAYLVEFDDSTSTMVATFDEDVDVTTITVAGGRAHGENLNVWREQRVSMKSRTKETAGVYLGWEVDDDEDGDADGEGEESPEGGVEEPTPKYVIELPEGYVIDPGGVLFFSLADADESSSVPAHLKPDEQDDEEADDDEQGSDHQNNPDATSQQAHDQQQEHDEGNNNSDDDDEGDDDEDEDPPREPIDFTVRIVDADGASADVPLSRFSMVQPQLEVQLRKAFLDDPRTESEAVFQSFVLPLEWFVDVNPELDTSRPLRLEFVFDRSAAGVVILDSVGFRPPTGL